MQREGSALGVQLSAEGVCGRRVSPDRGSLRAPLAPGFCPFPDPGRFSLCFGKRGRRPAWVRLSCGIRRGGNPEPGHSFRESELWGERGGASSYISLSLSPQAGPSLSAPHTHTDPYIPGRLLAWWSLENCPHFRLKGHQSESPLCPEYVYVCGAGSRESREGLSRGEVRPWVVRQPPPPPP